MKLVKRVPRVLISRVNAASPRLTRDGESSAVGLDLYKDIAYISVTAHRLCNAFVTDLQVASRMGSIDPRTLFKR